MQDPDMGSIFASKFRSSMDRLLGTGTDAEYVNHKVRIYKEYHSVCPLVGIGTLPTPLSSASVPLPPEPGRGHTRLRVRGWGSPISDYWSKA